MKKYLKSITADYEQPLEPPQPGPVYEENDDTLIEINIDDKIEVEDDGSFEFITPESRLGYPEWINDYYYSEEAGVKIVSEDEVLDRIYDMLEVYVPYRAGTYSVKAKVKLFYNVEVSFEEDYDRNWDEYERFYHDDPNYVEFNDKKSEITDVEVSKIER